MLATHSAGKYQYVWTLGHISWTAGAAFVAYLGSLASACSLGSVAFAIALTTFQLP